MAEKLEERPVGKSKPAWEHIAMYIKEKGWTGGRWGAVGMSAMESFVQQRVPVNMVKG